jgi:hypothetical protein
MASNQFLDRPATEAVAVDDNHQVCRLEKLPQRPESSEGTQQPRFLRIGDGYTGLLVSECIPDVITAMKQIYGDRFTTRSGQVLYGAGSDGLSANRNQGFGYKVGQGS